MHKDSAKYLIPRLAPALLVGFILLVGVGVPAALYRYEQENEQRERYSPLFDRLTRMIDGYRFKHQSYPLKLTELTVPIDVEAKEWNAFLSGIKYKTDGSQYYSLAYRLSHGEEFSVQSHIISCPAPISPSR